jgi:hypothetical protein
MKWTLDSAADSPMLNVADDSPRMLGIADRPYTRRSFMISERHFARWRWTLLLLVAALRSFPICAQTSAAPAKTELPLIPELRDGQRDFDFSIGTWQTHISRRLHPLTGSDEWADYVGSSIVRPLWNGRASLGETEADGPAGRLEALSLRLYNPKSRQWNLHYASTGGTTSTPTALSVATIGEFKNGRGEFFDTELFQGRNILVRNVWSDISLESIRFEQAFSEDGGRTWEINWIAVDTRVDIATVEPHPDTEDTENSSVLGGSGSHGFDFELGNWKTHLKFLMNPLTGSSTWVEFNGTSVVHKIWNGRANITELEVDGPSGHLEAMSLRLYNPESHQWSLNVASGRSGTMGGPPTVGEFHDGRGEFYDMEPINGKMILVRNIWSDLTANSCHFEQAFSADGGKTWKDNWIADDTRVKDGSDKKN